MGNQLSMSLFVKFDKNNKLFEFDCCKTWETQNWLSFNNSVAENHLER